MRITPPLRNPRLLLAGCLAAATITGCGSAATTTTTAPADQLAPNATSAQIYQAAMGAMTSVHSYRMAGTVTELTTPRTRIRMSLSVYTKQQLSMSVSTTAGSLTIILDGKRAYMSASRKFWLVHSNGNVLAANMFANHWLLTPPNSARKLAASFRNSTFSPAATKCMLRHGTLSRAGTTIVGQQDAVVIRDAGNIPGGQRGTLAVAMLGTPYLLRVSASGTTRPGGPRKGPCANSGPAAVGSMTMSDFNALGPLPVPAHAINLQALEHHGSSAVGGIGTAI